MWGHSPDVPVWREGDHSTREAGAWARPATPDAAKKAVSARPVEATFLAFCPIPIEASFVCLRRPVLVNVVCTWRFTRSPEGEPTMKKNDERAPAPARCEAEAVRPGACGICWEVRLLSSTLKFAEGSLVKSAADWARRRDESGKRSHFGADSRLGLPVIPSCSLVPLLIHRIPQFRASARLCDPCKVPGASPLTPL